MGLLITTVIILSMIFGLAITASAAEEYPTRINECTHGGQYNSLYLVTGFLDSGAVSSRKYTTEGVYQQAINLSASDFDDEIIIGRIYHRQGFRWSLCSDNEPCSDPVSSPTLFSVSHTHDFVTGTIYDATCDHDGLEGTYCKTCGYILNSSPISAFGYTLETYAQQKIEASKSGQKIVLEFGELNSFPKSFMEKIAARVAEGVTFEFRYNVNHVLQKITIPAYSTVDTNLDWYGPATMEQLYGAN